MQSFFDLPKDLLTNSHRSYYSLGNYFKASTNFRSSSSDHVGICFDCSFNTNGAF